jgi:hypothetical protein
MKGELDLCHAATEIWQKDAKVLQSKIDAAEGVNESLTLELYEVKCKKDATIR